MAAHRIDPHLVSLTAPGSFAAEQYQGLRLTIERLGRARQAKVIMVTSPGTGEGKTLTALNLAGSLASESRVLLIDADLRRPAVAEHLGISDGDADGLAGVIAGSCRLEQSVRTVVPRQLDVLPAGLPGDGIHQLLRSHRMEDLLQEARQRYDFIVIDTPPLLPVFDATVLAPLADGVLVVVAANGTPRKLLGEALNLLDPSKVIGLVFNRDDRPLFGYYDAYYGKKSRRASMTNNVGLAHLGR